ncbi:MAG: 2,3-diphosphoglycerate-dependent phosphoglycerate mutase [Sphingomonadaceae bacterium]
MTKLVLVRHGQSEWNKAGRFTGWWDVDLTDAGEEEARMAGRMPARHGHDFDLCYTSVLTRAIRTLDIALRELDRLWLPVIKHWRLNERHYGGLTGLNKQEMREKVGEEQVHIWRRSFDVPPPELERASEYDLSDDRRYAGVEVPKAESLKHTIERVLPYWEEEILPSVKAGHRVLVSAHGNSLRALVKHLSDISDEEIPKLEIPTGEPLVYELDEEFAAVERYYLKDRQPASRA